MENIIKFIINNYFQPRQTQKSLTAAPHRTAQRAVSAKCQPFSGKI